MSIESRIGDRKFKDAIPLPSGRKLCTLWDAAGYITALPKAEQKSGTGGLPSKR